MVNLSKMMSGIRYSVILGLLISPFITLCLGVVMVCVIGHSFGLGVGLSEGVGLFEWLLLAIDAVLTVAAMCAPLAYVLVWAIEIPIYFILSKLGKNRFSYYAAIGPLLGALVYTLVPVSSLWLLLICLLNGFVTSILFYFLTFKFCDIPSVRRFGYRIAPILP